MKFELRLPPPDQASADTQACPDRPEPPPAEEPADSSVRGRYGRAIDGALASLTQLRAHAWDHHLAQEPLTHGAPTDGSDNDDEAEAVFRPDRISGRSGDAR